MEPLCTDVGDFTVAARLPLFGDVSDDGRLRAAAPPTASSLLRDCEALPFSVVDAFEVSLELVGGREGVDTDDGDLLQTPKTHTQDTVRVAHHQM